MRLRIRFRLWTLLVLIALLSLPLAYTGRLWLSDYQEHLAASRKRHAVTARRYWSEGWELRWQANSIRQRGDPFDAKKVEELENRAEAYFHEAFRHESLSGRSLFEAST
jgi:hypothetical protein